MLDFTSIALALGAILLGAYYFFTRGYGIFEDHGIPTKRPLPMFGNSLPPLMRLTSFAEWVQDMYNIHSEAKYVGMYDLMTPVILIRDPELIKSVTVKNFEHFLDHRLLVDEVRDPLFARNLFSLRGEKWRDIRPTLSPAFTSSKLKAMFKLMSECGQYFADYMANLPEDETIVDIKDAFTRYTNDVIASCAFGMNINSMRDKNNKFYVYGREATSFGTLVFLKLFALRSMPRFTGLLGLKLVRTEIANFFKDLVATTIRVRDEQGIVRPDVIQLMMETRGKLGPGKELTIEDMTAQAFVFFFGGFDSTSTTMCFATHEIAANPDVHRKLQTEIDTVLEESNGEVTYEAVNNMKYLDSIINETLRLYAIAAVADRVCTKPFELPPALPGLKPFKLKTGDLIWMSIYGMQRDPQYFEDPNTFNPDRFLDDPKKVENTGAYIPFGIGPRMCLGNRFALLETKVLLFHLFSRCDVKICAKSTVPMRLRKSEFAMRAEGGFFYKLGKRKNVHPSLLKTAANGNTTD